MGAPVGVVVVLIRVEIKIRRFREQFPRLPDRAVRTLAGIRVDQLSAVGPENTLALGTDVRSNAETYPVSFCGSNHRVGDPRVPGRGIENYLA